ncbi:MAG: mcpA 1 [Firmicutes bacterium]|nr:mcpA 1 [Bacillota bacterium]
MFVLGYCIVGVYGQDFYLFDDNKRGYSSDSLSYEKCKYVTKKCRKFNENSSNYGVMTVNSIKLKLAGVTIVLFVISLGLLSWLSYSQAKSIILHDVEQELAFLAQNGSGKIESFLENNNSKLQLIARSPILSSGDNNAIRNYLNAEMKNNDIYEVLVWSDSAGVSISPNGDTMSWADNPLFQKAIRGETAIGNPDISPATNKLMVPVFTPIKSGDKITGVLLGIVKVEAVQQIILGIKTGETGYAYVIRNDGLTIFHPSQDLINKSNPVTDPAGSPALKAAVEKAIKGETGITSYEYKGELKYMAYAPVKGTSWSIGVNVPMREATARLSTFGWFSLVIIVVMLVIVSFIIYFIMAKITIPIIRLENAANRIAAGDLSIEKLGMKSRDEIGRLGLAFETMVGNLQKLVRQIVTSAEQVSASSEELTATAEQSAQAANQIANSITITAEGVENQSKALSGALGAVKSIVGGSKEEAAKTSTAVEITNKAVTVANEGNNAVATAINQMSSIRNTVDNSAKVIAELGERSKEIGQIVETISGIASQTNLLALNAAIEAARAGEQGKGFAVVAEEVRKLAEQSQEAAKQIAVLIGDIQGKTDEAVVAMTNGTQEVRCGAEVVDHAGSTFRVIDEHLKDVAGIALQTAEAMHKQTTLSQQVLNTMSEVDSIGHNISGQTQTISAATEQQSASMEEIASASQHLAELAEELRVAVSKFKL